MLMKSLFYKVLIKRNKPKIIKRIKIHDLNCFSGILCLTFVPIFCPKKAGIINSKFTNKSLIVAKP